MWDPGGKGGWEGGKAVLSLLYILTMTIYMQRKRVLATCLHHLEI